MNAGRTESGNRNIALQALRGAAACSVMLYHSAHFAAQRTGAEWVDQVFPGRLAIYGVIVFFVLSGYLMEAAVRRYDAKIFLLHRFARLYPTYWLICFVFFLVQSARAGAWEPIPWRALNLLPLGEIQRPLGVEWTLLYEVFFYLVCGLLCLWRRAHLAVMLAWLAVIAVSIFRFDQFGTVMQPNLGQIVFSTWNIGFICGGLAGHVDRSGVKLDAAWLTLIGLALVLLGNLATAFPDLLLVAPGMACIVLAIARSPTQTAAGPVLRTFFVLGECSYGLYLAHSLAIQIALQYVPPVLRARPLEVLAGTIGVGLAVGLLAGKTDIVLYRFLKERIDARLGRRGKSAPQTAKPPVNEPSASPAAALLTRAGDS